MIAQLNQLSTRRTRWLCYVFLAYIFSVVTFGMAYWGLYLSKSSNFLFNADVLNTQIVKSHRHAEETLSTERHTAHVLNSLLVELDKGIQPIDKRQPFSLTSSNQVVVNTSEFRYSYVFVGISDVVGIGLRVSDNAGNEVESIHVPDSGGRLPTTSKDWRRVTTGLLSAVETRIKETERQLESLSGDGPYYVWSFWDFLYFSSITQSTVGFGDIVPNGRAVRVLVMSQLLVTTTLLILVLNVVLWREGAGGSVEDRSRDPNIT